MTQPLHSIKKELGLYFSGTLKKFETPFVLLSSDFQKRVWKELLKPVYFILNRDEAWCKADKYKASSRFSMKYTD